MLASLIFPPTKKKNIILVFRHLGITARESQTVARTGEAALIGQQAEALKYPVLKDKPWISVLPECQQSKYI